MKKIINIEGMSCMHCVSRVEKALAGLKGVTDVQVDLKGKKAEVKAENISDEMLKEAVEDLGFDVTGIN